MPFALCIALAGASNLALASPSMNLEVQRLITAGVRRVVHANSLEQKFRALDVLESSLKVFDQQHDSDISLSARIDLYEFEMYLTAVPRSLDQISKSKCDDHRATLLYYTQERSAKSYGFNARAAKNLIESLCR
jgi:hypothetical protein